MSRLTDRLDMSFLLLTGPLNFIQTNTTIWLFLFKYMYVNVFNILQPISSYGTI